MTSISSPRLPSSRYLSDDDENFPPCNALESKEAASKSKRTPLSPLRNIGNIPKEAPKESLYLARKDPRFDSYSSDAPKVKGLTDAKLTKIIAPWQKLAVEKERTLFVTDNNFFKSQRVIVTEDGHLIAVECTERNKENCGTFKHFTQAKDLHAPSKRFAAVAMPCDASNNLETAINEMEFLLRLKDIDGIARCWMSITYRNNNNNEEILLILDLGDHGDLWKALNVSNLTFERQDLRSITKQLLSTLKKIEDLGLIHRDIKARNIILSSRSEADHKEKGRFKVKLIDFGAMCEEKDKAAKALMKTTPLAASPELARRLLAKTPELVSATTNKLDVWQIGVCIYQIFNKMIASRVLDKDDPFPWFKGAKRPLECYEALKGYTSATVNFDALAKVDKTITTLLQKMLVRKPSDRASAKELYTLYEQLIANDPI